MCRAISATMPLSGSVMMRVAHAPYTRSAMPSPNNSKTAALFFLFIPF